MFLGKVSLLSVPVSSFVATHARSSAARRSQAAASVALQRLYSSSAKKAEQQRSPPGAKTGNGDHNPDNNKIQIPTWVPDFGSGEDSTSGYQRPVIQWYPGHIAKAERVLKETFQAVDVVIEVRDARAPKATSHPKVPEWCSGRPRLVVFTHVDLVPTTTHRVWKDYYEGNSQQTKEHESSNNKATEQYLWVNAKQGQGIQGLHRAIFKSGAYVQERRQRRGLKDRPLRVGLMGYPNVGKSALINRLLGRRRARTANIPGVTRSLQWIRVRSDDTKKTHKKEYELLDSPGIIPASLSDQSDALLLAACHCIGEASYDNQVVASYLCQWMQNLLITGKAEIAAPEWRDNCRTRWGFDPLHPVPVENPFDDEENTDCSRYVTGEEMLYKVADNTCKGNPEDAARKILQDFRAGRMGSVCLQLAPTELQANTNSSGSGSNNFEDFSQVPDPRMGTMRTDGMKPSYNWEEHRAKQEAEQLERTKTARETAKERGLELPPQLENPTINNKQNTPDNVGKGLFDGW